jgi:hypothetical protein
MSDNNFCPRCGKRTADPTTIHTCTPPVEDNATGYSYRTYGEATFHVLGGMYSIVEIEQMAEEMKALKQAQEKNSWISMKGVKEIAAEAGAFYGFPPPSVSTPNAGGKCVTAGETAPTKEIDPNQWAFDRGLEST